MDRILRVKMTDTVKTAGERIASASRGPLFRACGIVLLGGWALVFPPLTPDGSAVKADAPVEDWVRFAHFDTEDACRGVLSGLKSNPKSGSGAEPRLPHATAGAQMVAATAARAQAARCVPVEDARPATRGEH